MVLGNWMGLDRERCHYSDDVCDYYFECFRLNQIGETSRSFVAILLYKETNLETDRPPEYYLRLNSCPVTWTPESQP